MIKVAIVDDSAFMRKAIEKMLENESDIDIVATGRNGLEAVDIAKKYHPDIMTLDIEMPQMNGLDALRKIMKEAPTNVIMVSSLTMEGAEETLEALNLGAVDFIPKNLSFVSLDIIKIKDDLLRKIRTFARNKAHRVGHSPTVSTATVKEKKAVERINHKKPAKSIDIVTIGVSTGGPPALQKVIPNLPANLPVPVLVVQHMPASFTGPLAKRLDGLSKVTVKEAKDGDRLEKGVVYIAHGGEHMLLKSKMVIATTSDAMGKRHVPSVDIMDKSVAEYYGANMLGVILTGMGNDGLEGLKYAKSRGAYVIAQNEQTCVVYGMPKAVVDAGIADDILPITKIAWRISELVL